MSTNNVIMPDDYKDIIYRITYRLLGKVAPYVPRAIKPNQITIAGFISALIGSALLYFVTSPAAYLYWVLFNFIWYLLDSLDGIHARLTQQTSEYGAFLDHALDNIYFIFMFTIFTVKFDLLHTLYIFILLLRITGAVMVFTVQFHTKRLYLNQFSVGFELFLMTTAMILSYYFPYFNPTHYTTNPILLHLIGALSLQEGFFMKSILLIYTVGVPITFILQFNFVKRELS